MSAPTDAEVVASLTTMLGEVIGEDELSMLDDITLETSFNEDLELESIEFVALAELLMEHYGERVDFVAWIAEMELEQIIEMTVGELVRFFVGCLDEPAACPCPTSTPTGCACTCRSWACPARPRW
jgi:acyl carrier protein